MIVASCCGQMLDISPNDFLVLRTVAFICAALLVGEAAVLFFGLRRSRDHLWAFWQNKLLLCTLGLGALAVVLAQYAQHGYQDALALVASVHPLMDDMGIGSAGTPAIAYTIVLCAITLAMLGVGAMQLLTEAAP